MGSETLRVTFYGAAETVTGSRYLIESSRHRVLIDCGLFQGKKDNGPSQKGRQQTAH